MLKFLDPMVLVKRKVMEREESSVNVEGGEGEWCIECGAWGEWKIERRGR